jgi:hypothetical protein
MEESKEPLRLKEMKNRTCGRTRLHQVVSELELCLYISNRGRRQGKPEEVKSTLIHMKWYQSLIFVCILQTREEKEDRALETLWRLIAGRQQSGRQSGRL